jgi:hypothetical protein
MSNWTIKALKAMSSFSTTDYRKERLFGEACNQYLEKHGIPRERLSEYVYGKGKGKVTKMREATQFARLGEDVGLLLEKGLLTRAQGIQLFRLLNTHREHLTLELARQMVGKSYEESKSLIDNVVKPIKPMSRKTGPFDAGYVQGEELERLIVSVEFRIAYENLLSVFRNKGKLPLGGKELCRAKAYADFIREVLVLTGGKYIEVTWLVKQMRADGISVQGFAISLYADMNELPLLVKDAAMKGEITLAQLRGLARSSRLPYDEIVVLLNKALAGVSGDNLQKIVKRRLTEFNRVSDIVGKEVKKAADEALDRVALLVNSPCLHKVCNTPNGGHLVTLETLESADTEAVYKQIAGSCQLLRRKNRRGTSDKS